MSASDFFSDFRKNKIPELMSTRGTTIFHKPSSTWIPFFLLFYWIVSKQGRTPTRQYYRQTDKVGLYLCEWLMKGWDAGEEAGEVVPGNRRADKGSGNNVWRWVEQAGGEEARLSKDIWWMDGKWQRSKGAWGITVSMSPERWDTETDCDKTEDNLKGQLQQFYTLKSVYWSCAVLLL